MQQQIDDLMILVATNTSRIEALRRRADRADDRADAAEQRADRMEADALTAREVLAELQADGVLSREHVAQLDQALVSSRRIGAAVGLLMANRQITDEEALEILKGLSQRTNRKLRDIAEDLLEAANRDALQEA